MKKILVVLLSVACLLWLFYFTICAYDLQKCEVIEVVDLDNSTVVTVVRDDGHMYDVAYGRTVLRVGDNVSVLFYLGDNPTEDRVLAMV